MAGSLTILDSATEAVGSFSSPIMMRIFCKTSGNIVITGPNLYNASVVATSLTVAMTTGQEIEAELTGAVHSTGKYYVMW